MKWSMIASSAIALFSVGLLFTSNAPQQEDFCTLQVGQLEQYYTSKRTFEESKKQCNVGDNKIVTYGNLLCAEHHEHTHHYTIHEIWYRVKTKKTDCDHDTEVVTVRLLSKRKFVDERDQQLDTKEGALCYIAEHKPRGLNENEPFELWPKNWPDSNFLVPKNALLLSFLHAVKKCAWRLFCIDGQNIMGVICIGATFLKLEDKRNSDSRYDGFTRSIGIPEEYRGVPFESQEAALKALSAHIDKTHFNQ